MIESYDPGAQFYDHVPDYRQRPDVGFFVAQAQAAGGPVLELGCGTGRILIPTAQAGVEIVGLDKSPAMLAICEMKLAEEPEAVRARASVIEGNMRGFDLGRKFALITTPFRSFQRLLTVDDQLASLNAMQSHLAPEGRVILDLFNPDTEYMARQTYPSEPSPGTPFTMPDGRRVVRRDRTLAHDPLHQMLDVEILYEVAHPDGYTEAVAQRFQTRYLFRYEAEHLLARVGFRVEAVYADYDGTPFGKRYPGELILIAGR